MNSEDNKNREMHGEPDLWDKNWKNIMVRNGPKKSLFTQGEPNTVSQLIHTAYAKDLFYLAGDSDRSKRYLELGCGRGTTSMYLANWGCRVTLADLSPHALELAKEKFKEEGLHANDFIKADAEATRLPSNSYDYIYNIGLLEHFEDPVPVLREAWRLLRPGGIIFMVIVPVLSFDRRWLNELFFAPWRLVIQPLKGLIKKIIGWEPKEDGRYIRTSYKRSHYVSWMKELGATNISCIPYNPFLITYSEQTYPMKLIFKLYKHHYMSRTKRKHYPLLRAWNSTAACDLLICKK